jgi:hypothetical protein
MTSSGKKEELVAVFDIGSGSAGVAMISVRKGDKAPKILFSIRTPIKFQDNFKFEDFLSNALKSLETSARHMALARLGAPDSVHCFLSAPWSAAQTRVIKLSRSAPFIFTEKMATDLACKEIKSFEEEHAERYEREGGKIRLLEGEVMQIKLNGYATANPYGKKAKSLEAALFASLAPESVLSAAEETISKFFSRSVRFHSSVFAAFAALRDLYPKSQNFIFLDVSGELSEIALAQDDILEESVSIPYGKNHFLRALRKAGYDSGEASSALNLFSSGRAGEKIRGKVSGILASPGRDWLRALEEALHQISAGRKLPKDIFLAADQDFASYVSSLAKREELHQHSVTESKFNVIILRSDDPGFFLESVFISRLN